MITVYHTESGSVYEVDSDGPRVRRVTGTTPPTPYFGQDGVWQPCISAREFTAPNGTVDLLVHWRDLKITWTSPIITAYCPLPAHHHRQWQDVRQAGELAHLFRPGGMVGP